MKFKEAFLLASRYVSTKPSHPVLACLAIKDNTMIAFDLMTAIAIPLDEPIADICVPVGVISKLLKKFKGDVNVYVDKDKRDRLSLTLQQGSSRQSVEGLPIEEYPELPTVEYGDSVWINGAVLAQAFKELKPTLCKDETKRLLTGLNLKIANGKAISTATNGHAATQTSFATIKDSDRDWNITIPPKFFEVLDIKSECQLHLYHDDLNICMAIGHIKVYQRLLSGNYPNIPDLTRQQFSCLDRFLKKGLLDNLAIAKAYGTDDVDLHIVHNPNSRSTKTYGDGELIVAIEMKDALTCTFNFPTPSPLWLAFSAHIIGEYSTVVKGLRLGYSSDRSLTADLRHEYVTGAMDYRLPIQSRENQSAKVSISKLEALIKATPKDKELLISLRNKSEFAPNAIVLYTLGSGTVSVLCSLKEDPKPLVAEVVEIVEVAIAAEVEPMSVEDLDSLSRLDRLVEIGNSYRKDTAIAKPNGVKMRDNETNQITRIVSMANNIVSIKREVRYNEDSPDKAIVLGLRPDLAIRISTGEVKALIYPADIGYRGLAFLCSSTITNDDEVEDISRSLMNLGADEDQAQNLLTLDAIIGHCKISDVSEIKDQVEWQSQSQIYGLPSDFDSLKSMLNSESIFVHHIQDPVELDDYVENIGAIVGEVIDRPDIKLIYRLQEAHKRALVK